ncbi:MAG: exodeoxyribonuclease V subunit gamma, partial [Lachnospiraceae bacterium]|nr:exodeoxyribonuclease V subunit gamma [Lachnospiraceae bacterium]
LSELYQYRIDGQELDRIIQATAEEPLLQRKLKEIRTIYHAFDRSMEEDTIPSERLYDVLCRLIPQSKLVAESVITFDGFTGFTPAQYQVLETLMIHAKRVIVTVTVDGELAENSGNGGSATGRDLAGSTEKNEMAAGDSKTLSPRKLARLASDRQLFDMSLTTVQTLRYLAEKNQVAIAESQIFAPGARFADVPELAALERQFLRCPVEPWQAEGHARDKDAAATGITVLEETASTSVSASDPIHLWEVGDRTAEMEAVTRQIFTLVREQGLRYRDIAVVSGDVTGYEPVIRRVFGAAEIPYFLDVKNNMMGHPLVAYLRGALETVEKDFTYETVFACLKSGMTPIGPVDLYELENYVLALGLRGRKAWGETWEKTYPEGRHLNLERLNQVREQVVRPLFALRDILKNSDSTVRDYAEGLVRLMESQGVEKRLKDMAGQIAADGEDSLGQEYEQAYAKVLELLDKVVELFGDGKVSIREWREILDTGFGEIRVGVIPARVDRVVIGDMHRTRLKDPKVLFFVGANDGLVPKAGDKTSLLSDMDRRSLAKLGVQLAPTKQENGFIDRFYLYLTLTKPSQQLYVSWCCQNVDGSAMSPSYMIRELQGIFPALIVERPEEQVELADHILTKDTARSALLAGFADYKEGRAPAAWKELYSIFMKEPDGREQLRRWLDAAFLTYKEETMGPAVAKALYGDMLSGSVTRLEQYAACAYAQFLSYGLQLAQRRLHEFAAADMGTLFHEVIRKFFAKVYGKNSDVTEMVQPAEKAGTTSAAQRLITDEKLRQRLVHQCLEEAVNEGSSRGLEDTARGAYLLERVERTADRTLWALCEQLARGDFHPEDVEVDFDGRDSKAMNLLLQDDTLMRLHGRIDRVDTCNGRSVTAQAMEKMQEGMASGDVSEGDTGEAHRNVEDDEIYVKVIDYKTGSTTFDLVGVYYGLQLQLVVYLDAAMERERAKNKGKKVIPAGILYYNIRDPFVAVEPEEAGTPDPNGIKDGLLKELKMNGIVNRDRRIYSRMDRLIGADVPPVIPVTEKGGQIVERYSSVAATRQLEDLCAFVRRRMTEFGSRIMAGHMAVNPYMRDGRTGCDYCKFAAVCGFDKKTPGYEYRRLGDLEAREIWDNVEKG